MASVKIKLTDTNQTGRWWSPTHVERSASWRFRCLYRRANCHQVNLQTTSIVTYAVLRCCWLGLLTGKTHYRVGEPTAACQFVDICQHRSFDNGRQYVSCGQRQPPVSGAPVNKWLSTITRERWIPLDPESGGFPYLFGTFLSTHIGSAWRARHDNNNKMNFITFF